MSKLRKNILYNFAYQILVLITPLVTSPYISRILGVNGIGSYSYVSSVAYYFYIFVTLGLTNYGNRSIAKCGNNREQRSKIFWSIYATQLTCGVIVIALYLVYTINFADCEYRKFFFVYFLYIFSAVFDINWLYFGLEEFKLSTVRNTIVKIATLICIFSFVRGDNALTAYFAIVAGSSLMSCLLLWTKISNYLDYYKPSLHECLKHIKPNLLLFIPIVAMSIYRVMDKIMIKELSGIVENGYYESADRIISISMTAFSAVSTVMMPAVSNMVAQKEHDAVKKMLRNMMRVVNWLSIAMVFGLMAISQRFVPLFFGESFAEAGVLLIGLAPTIFLSGWKNVLRSQYLIPYEKDKAYVESLVVGAACNVIFNLIFIPRFAAKGAVIGTLIAEVAGFIIQTWVAGKEIRIRNIFRDFLPFIPCGIIMAIASAWILTLLPYNLLSVAAVIFVGAIIYVILSFLTLYFIDKKMMIQLMNNIWMKKLWSVNKK